MSDVNDWNQSAYDIQTTEGQETAFNAKRLVDKINSNTRGIVSTIGNVTLTVSAASTTVKHYGVSATSWVMLMPLDATTAAEYVLGTTYVTPAKGQFVIQHPNNGNTRKYRYVFLSGIRL